MSVRIVASLAFVSAAILCAGGCKKESRPRAGTSAPATPSAQAPQQGGTELTAATVNGPTATDQMIEARCARAAACNQVGWKARFDSRAACVERVSVGMNGLLTKQECPAGINEKALTTCLDAIKNEPCDGPLNTLDLQSCGLADLCTVRPAPRL